jgi:fluoroacetyl-CoA thioesterase
LSHSNGSDEPRSQRRKLPERRAFSKKTRRRGATIGKLQTMQQIQIGARGSYTLRVEPHHLASSFKDGILPPVFSTPYLLLIMENAALNAIRQYLEPGESAVGTRVDIRHRVATPVGREVAGHAEVVGVEGRRIDFRIWATDGAEEIGAGTHERTVVSVGRMIEKMAAKYGPAAS